jgi:DUF2075 family protein
VLVYTATKADFVIHVAHNQIADRILEAFKNRGGIGVSPAEVASWQNSLQFMRTVVDDRHIPDDAGVALEFTIPQTSKRVDFVLTGQGRAPRRRETAVIVELKQWTTARATEKDGVVSTFVGGSVRDVAHPSYQAWSYAAILQDYNETVQLDDIDLRPCAYLHNSDSQDLQAPFYQQHLDRAPLYLKTEFEKLQRFIRQHVHYGDTRELLYRIDAGRIRPSKDLSDHLASLLAGNTEFTLIDEQKVVFETALNASEEAQTGDKQVYIVEGGPGTGKSVVAINLLVELTKRGQVVQYVSKNAAPRAVYAAKLAGSLQKTRINNLFKGSGAFVDTEADTFGTLIVDEAHRLNEKSGLYKNLGDNQVKEIIRASRASVFFIDESQRVTLDDIGRVAEIETWARQAGACVTHGGLESQFRCNGSDGYLAWLDHVLQVRPTANPALAGIDYDFRVMDSPAALRDAIVTANRANNRSRMVAGYCWDWVSRKRPDLFDITFPDHDFAAQWNLDKDGSLWIMQENSVEQVGCIHTCQGLELDYVGVILGTDLLVRDGRVLTDANQRSSNDRSVRGYKSLLKRDRAGALRAADGIVKNTYRTLMSRGSRGCYVWSVDEETNEYLSHSGWAVD